MLVPRETERTPGNRSGGQNTDVNVTRIQSRFQLSKYVRKTKTSTKATAKTRPTTKIQGKNLENIFFCNSNLTTPGRACIESEVALFDIESILVKKLLKSILNDKNV